MRLSEIGLGEMRLSEVGLGGEGLSEKGLGEKRAVLVANYEMQSGRGVGRGGVMQLDCISVWERTGLDWVGLVWIGLDSHWLR